MKVIVNRCFGGFSISPRALELLVEKKGLDPSQTEISTHCSELRTDPDLISVVETLGPAANTWASKLEVIEVPDGVKWHVVEYDGREHIAEDHRTW